MQWIEKFDLFLFDFDGLLVDTENLHFLAYKNAIKAYGYTLSWNLLTFLGHAHVSSQHLSATLMQKYPEIFTQISWDAFYREKKVFYQNSLKPETLSLMPGVAELVENLRKKNKSCVIVTNSTKTQVETITAFLPLLKDIPTVTREDYSRAKPSSSCYEKAISCFPHKKRIVGFEDSLRGIQALAKTRAVPVFIQKKEYPLYSRCFATKAICVDSFFQLSSSCFTDKVLSQEKAP